MDSDQKFKNGAIVRLKSGGPNMTIADYGTYDYSVEKLYKCRWFDDKHKLTEALFSEAELELPAAR